MHHRDSDAAGTRLLGFEKWIASRSLSSGARHRAMWDYWPHTRAGTRVTVKGERPV
jgi:hypothetical protein